MKKSIIVLFLLATSIHLLSAQKLQKDSKAVTIARAQVEAWSNHEWDKAQKMLANDVHITVTTTQPIMATALDLHGIDNYMIGLKKFAMPVIPGSAHILASSGDDHNAMLMVSVKAEFGGKKVTLTGARLYLLDDDYKIKTEQVIFFTMPE